jgi:tetratricopeptide (TPR) repeat protein
MLVSILLQAPARAAVPADSLAIAAEYYFSRQDYPQALSLWSEVLKRKPDSVSALMRVAELKLLFGGRLASRDVLLGFLNSHGSSLPAESRLALRLKLGSLQSTFVTDEGQSLFLRALPKAQRQECAAALPLLTQAVGLEGGNLKVLHEKARCEKKLGLYPRLYETLKLAFDSDPFDVETRESLLETEIYFAEMANVVTSARRDPEAVLNARERTALAVALFETGAEAEALPLLQALVESEKTTSGSPILLYTLGRLFSGRSGGSGEAVSYLERFLSLAARPENTLIDGWDPYRCAEKLEPAHKLLASLKVKPVGSNAD